MENKNNNIRPISDLRNHFADISRQIHEGQTVILTKNGYGDMVVTSMENYRRWNQPNLQQIIAEAAIAMKEDPTFFSKEDVFAPLYADANRLLEGETNA